MTEQRLLVTQRQKLSQSVQTALSLLSMDLDSLSEYMAKAVQENPALEYVPPARSPLDFAVKVRTRFRTRGALPENILEQSASPVTVLDDLEQQLRLAGLSKGTLRLATAMLWQLSPRGYFLREISDFARDENVRIEDAQAALMAVQALEPAGIGARNVGECLTLQLRTREPNIDPLCYDLVQVHLMDICKGNVRAVMRETGASIERVTRCIDTIRELTPIPCLLSEGDTQFTMPEFSVEQDANGTLAIAFHNDYYPSFRQDETFRQLTESLVGEEKAYARRMLLSASKLMQAVELRQTTMEKIAAIITREQRAFFLGRYSLVPLSCAQVAEEIGVHEATVYRAVQNKYLYCMRGTFALSHFFQREVSSGTSAERVREMIRGICQSGVRISDQGIADELKKRGVSISRRTVAKYRAQMDISSSFQRKHTDISQRR